MLDTIFASIISSTITFDTFILCSAASIILGIFLALTHTFKNRASKSFTVTLALLPFAVEAVIMLVNGNLGAGVAVAGAFSLVRFRSAPGSAREICSIFLAMALGLATGMGYIGIAAVFTLLACLMTVLLTAINFGAENTAEKELKITIPESLDYTGMFDDLFQKYTTRAELTKVRTANMGSLYKLSYIIELRDNAFEKQMIDEIRTRNGNLDIACGKIAAGKDEL